MKTYAISYKSYYHELCDWSCVYVRARDQESALRQFARRHQISIPKSHDLTDWKWEEGEWLHVFKLINDVTLRPCPRCGGSGEIEIH